MNQIFLLIYFHQTINLRHITCLFFVFCKKIAIKSSQEDSIFDLNYNKKF